MAPDRHSMLIIAGCVGGIVAVLTLSALGFCARTKTSRGDNVGGKESLNQDETIDKNFTYANITVTNQDNKISDDHNVCESKTKTDPNTGGDSTDEDNQEKGSDVIYAEVHVSQKNPKAISVVPEDINSQVKT